MIKCRAAVFLILITILVGGKDSKCESLSQRLRFPTFQKLSEPFHKQFSLIDLVVD